MEILKKRIIEGFLKVNRRGELSSREIRIALLRFRLKKSDMIIVLREFESDGTCIRLKRGRGLKMKIVRP